MNVPVEQQIPLIWTSQGNLPEADLRLEVEWSIEPGSYVKVVKRHFLGDELVKEGADVLSLNGMSGEAVINNPA